MDYSQITKDNISDSFKDFFTVMPQQRMVRLYTGMGGIDIFNETMENRLGFTRVYIGIKVMRILRYNKPIIKKSVKGVYYKLIKTKNND